jgi:GTP-binding protein
MVPADASSISKEYRVLLKELELFNPELLNKKRILAITKCDLIDEELEKMLKKTLPKKVPYVFISAHTNKGLVELKDMLWNTLQEEE